MKESFVDLQKRAREIEKRISKMPEDKDNQVGRARLIREWQDIKNQLAQALVDKGGL